MALHRMRCDQQTKSNLLPTLMTTGEFFPGDTSHFVIVVMAAMANLVNP